MLMLDPIGLGRSNARHTDIVVFPRDTYSSTSGTIIRPFNNYLHMACVLTLRIYDLTADDPDTIQKVRWYAQYHEAATEAEPGNQFAGLGATITETLDEHSTGYMVVKIAPGASPVHRYTYNDCLPGKFYISMDVREDGTAECAMSASFMIV